MTTLHVQKGSVREALSVPLQQTARYLKYYPQDVTPEEYAAIAALVPPDAIAAEYDPQLSDPVKFKMNWAVGSEDMKGYFRAWASMLEKHPLVYIEATLNNGFGYVYPFYNQPMSGVYHNYIKGEPVATGDFDFHYVFSSALMDKLSNYELFWCTAPVLSVLLNPGMYTWLLLLCAGCILYKRKRGRELLLLAGPALSVAVCLASPVNGHLRYILPLTACTPTLLALAVFLSARCGPPQRDRE